MPQEAFREWIVIAESDRTREAYQAISQGSAAGCNCADCRNWMDQRDYVFPEEVLTFLSLVGIDYTKESEVSEYGGGNYGPDCDLYIGHFHFIGRLVSGPDAVVAFHDGRGCKYEFVKVQPGLKIGLSANLDMSGPIPRQFLGEELVAVFFEAEVNRGQTYA